MRNAKYLTSGLGVILAIALPYTGLLLAGRYLIFGNLIHHSHNFQKNVWTLSAFSPVVVVLLFWLCWHIGYSTFDWKEKPTPVKRRDY